MLSRQGFAVDIFELRSDLRLSSELSVGRSINLALSVRGQQTLRLLGVEDEVLERHAIPMYARMIHNVDGSIQSIPYGARGQCIYSVGRKYLLELLLNLADEDPKVRLHFDHKLLRAKFKRGELDFAVSGSEVTKRGYRAVIGCDGVFSKVRQDVMRCGRFDFEQRYIDHGYVELCIPPKVRIADIRSVLENELCKNTCSGEDYESPYDAVVLLFNDTILLITERRIPNGCQLPSYLASRRVHDDRSSQSGQKLHRHSLHAV